jgi:hypothetical protein
VTGRGQQTSSQAAGPPHAAAQALAVVNDLPVVSQNQRQPPNCGADRAAGGGAARDPLATAIMTTRNSVAINDLFM